MTTVWHSHCPTLTALTLCTYTHAPIFPAGFVEESTGVQKNGNFRTQGLKFSRSKPTQRSVPAFWTTPQVKHTQSHQLGSGSQLPWTITLQVSKFCAILPTGTVKTSPWPFGFWYQNVRQCLIDGQTFLGTQ
ncbi:hypothetical protein H4582DRAFT_1316268 [Lactarius indigo]|nr:hypothetical protein H4582DRAFT_1316268 [Lactarius indigo]